MNWKLCPAIASLLTLYFKINYWQSSSLGCKTKIRSFERRSSFFVDREAIVRNAIKEWIQFRRKQCLDEMDGFHSLLAVSLSWSRQRCGKLWAKWPFFKKDCIASQAHQSSTGGFIVSYSLQLQNWLKGIANKEFHRRRHLLFPL